MRVWLGCLLALFVSCAQAQVTPGTSPLTIAKGGTNAATASAARTSLGLAIGTNVEAWDADLDCLAALGTTGVLQRTGGGTCATLTNTQLTALINLATASLPGALPAWPNNTATYFRGDGTYATLNFAALGGQATFAQFPTGTSDTVLGYWGGTVASATSVPNCSNSLTYSTTTHLWGCNTSAGTGTVTSVATAGLATGGPISSTGTVTVTAAVKADQTTHTSTSVAVVPAVQQNHPSAVKAHVSFSSCTSSPCTLLDSYNATSVTRAGVGVYALNFAVPFSSANYACSILTGSSTASMVSVISAAPTASAFNFTTYTNSTAPAVQDPTNVMVMCAGAQ